MPKKITYNDIYEIVKSTINSLALASTSYNISGTVTVDLKPYQDAILKLDFKDFIDTTLASDITAESAGDLDAIFKIDKRKVNTFVPDANGGSILLNGDRIILNAKSDFSMLFGQKGVAIASPERVNIDAGQSITLFTPESLFLGLPNRGQSVNKIQKTQGELGDTKGDPTPDYAYEPMVLGVKLANLLEDLVTAVSDGDLVSGLSNASWQPSTIAEFQLLANRLPEILSTYAYVDGVSHEDVNQETLKQLKAKQKATKPFVPPSEISATVVGTITPPLNTGVPSGGPVGTNTTVAGSGGYPVNESTAAFINQHCGGVNPATLLSDGTMKVDRIEAPTNAKQREDPLKCRHWLTPNPAYVAALTSVTIPLAGGKTSTVKLHPSYAQVLQPALAEIASNGGREYIVSCAGGLAVRNVTNGTRLANHAYGFALDVNSSTDGFQYGAPAWNFEKQTVGSTPWNAFQRGFYEKVALVMKKYNITWLSSMDPMHFSIHE